jgi:hypothetical protein
MDHHSYRESDDYENDSEWDSLKTLEKEQLDSEANLHVHTAQPYVHGQVQTSSVTEEWSLSLDSSNLPVIITGWGLPDEGIPLQTTGNAFSAKGYENIAFHLLQKFHLNSLPKLRFTVVKRV